MANGGILIHHPPQTRTLPSSMTDTERVGQKSPMRKVRVAVVAVREQMVRVTCNL
jgi:hypothetical protein